MKALVKVTLTAALLVGALAVVDVSSATSAQGTCNSAPDARVDLAEPTFSDPTSITNPLFPVGTTGQTLELGAEAGAKLRFEITDLPDTRVFQWGGRDIVTRASHFVGYMEGRLIETAVDYYAQDDAGNVWYFGEDVSNYENGVVVDKEGTWFAGQDGPPGMIMPADPQVGDVYRPENIPGLVFEEVTVQATDMTISGPQGDVGGAVFVQECLMDGTVEDKQFAPGYGESLAHVKADRELYRLALAVPIDALPEPVPGELDTLASGAATVFDAVHSREWVRARSTVDAMDRAWDTFTTRPVPELLKQQMQDALDALDASVNRRRPAEARQAAIDVGHAGLDLELRHRSQDDVDKERIGLWKDQLLVDQEAGDKGGATGDRVIINTIRNRIR